MTTPEFIQKMKAHAAYEANEAQRSRKRWHRLAMCSYAVGALFLILAPLMPSWVLMSVSAMTGVAWLIGARSTWKQGDFFATRWMELREEALGYAHQAEQGLL